MKQPQRGFLTVVCLLSLQNEASLKVQPNVLYPSYRYNQRNFWLEYSTPPSTTFPDYDAFTTSPPDPTPIFVNAAKRNNSVISVPAGSTLMMDCIVENLMDFKVTWLRKKSKSLHILTIGHDPFSADSRYSVAYKSAVDFYTNSKRNSSMKTENWRLKIKPVVKGDNGSYTCQLSNHPPKVLVTHLNVIVPSIKFVDPDTGTQISEKHYKPDSTIELFCLVKNFLPKFESIIWRHNGKLLTQKDFKRGGISIKSRKKGKTVQSKLYVGMADAEDSGIYSCSVDNVAKARLSLHILNGEEPAAIHSGTSALEIYFLRQSLLFLLCFFFLIY